MERGGERKGGWGESKKWPEKQKLTEMERCKGRLGRFRKRKTGRGTDVEGPLARLLWQCSAPSSPLTCLGQEPQVQPDWGTVFSPS